MGFNSGFKGLMGIGCSYPGSDRTEAWHYSRPCSTETDTPPGRQIPSCTTLEHLHLLLRLF